MRAIAPRSLRLCRVLWLLSLSPSALELRLDRDELLARHKALVCIAQIHAYIYTAALAFVPLRRLCAVVSSFRIYILILIPRCIVYSAELRACGVADMTPLEAYGFGGRCMLAGRFVFVAVAKRACNVCQRSQIFE